MPLLYITIQYIANNIRIKQSKANTVTDARPTKKQHILSSHAPENITISIY